MIESITFRTGPEEKQIVATLLWLPGANQRADNELLRRLVNALHDADIPMLIAGLSGKNTIDSYLQKHAPPSPLILGGHSMGGAAALTYATNPGKFDAIITANAAGVPPTKSSVPILFVAGENDTSLRYCHMGPKPGAKPKETFDKGEVEQLVTVTHGSQGSDGNLTVLIARNGDHSLRWNSKGSDEAKEQASFSEETKAMNMAVAAIVCRFVRKEPLDRPADSVPAESVPADCAPAPQEI
eukprot:TRINITY_DN33954_c0_g1_i1.p1 TRINITY_DN33954_c0_g1~~TRINITY_DN33954_c0_g1_i1.p1  ORF type:complete len:241 (+),score=48.99 TRINITY_DN33954_c0_g1_i1:244-966(+)